MKLSDFDYQLPKELIAQYPLKQRDEARLLVLDRNSGSIKHTVFKNLTDFLYQGDGLIVNDTKVLPARLFGIRTTGGKVEVLVLGRKDGPVFRVLIKPARVKLGEKILFNSGALAGIVTAKSEITFQAQDPNQIYKHGLMPLPPYIKRRPEAQDQSDYQTVYARDSGSIAAPTAGLHFTKELLEKIRAGGISIGSITLHISYATFKPVQCEDIARHAMEAEYFTIPPATLRLISDIRKRKGRIITVGTTSLRTLETYATGVTKGYTNLFIYPGYQFSLVNCLLTNFHLPRTTLFILVCAFAGQALIKKVYQEAIDKRYRFYSYGDAMLII